MRIDHISLFRYVPFKSSEIELLELDLPSEIQNVIGTNGSGKSALLRELNPNPAVRTDYGEDGYKHIQLTHDGLSYVLQSNFANPSAPHSFVCAGIELNPSGTTPVQKELVVNHLGYTAHHHAIAYGDYRLSTMQVGYRKTFLLTTHPCQLQLVLDKHKALTRKLNAHRNNLAMLHERKTTLEQQLIAADQKQQLEVDNTRLTDTLAQVVDAASRLQHHHHQVNTTLEGMPTQYPTRSRQTILQGQKHYGQYHAVARDIPYADCQQGLLREIAVLGTQRENLLTRTQTLIREIDKYTSYIQQNDAAGALETMSATIDTLTTSITQLQQSPPLESPFEPFILESIATHLERLTDLIGFFIGYGQPIPSFHDVTRLAQKLDRDQRRLRNLSYAIDALRPQVSQSEAALLATSIQDIPLGCQCCVLFERYQASLHGVQARYQQLQDQQNKLLRQQRYLTVLVDGRGAKLALYNQALPSLQNLQDYLQTHRFLLQPLQGLDLLHTVRTNPSMLLVRIASYAQRSQTQHLLQQKKHELDHLLERYQQLQTPNQLGKDFLVQMVVEKQQELIALRQQFSQLDASLAKKQSDLDLLERYVEELRQLKHEQATLQHQYTHANLVFDQQVCELYRDHLQQMKRQIVGQLTEIDRVLREQAALESRYHHEVLASMQTIEAQLLIDASLEAALSPTTGLPHRYMVQFINDLISHANLFISEVFLYPFEFIPLTEDAQFDYKFKMRVNDIIVPDIAQLSDGQQDMANLAFNLALVIERRQTAYPYYLDEVDRYFDLGHKQRLLTFLKSIVEDGLMSQLLLINHNALVYSGLVGAETLVLSPDNIVVPEVVNTHAMIQKYGG